MGDNVTALLLGEDVVWFRDRTDGMEEPRDLARFPVLALVAALDLGETDSRCLVRVVVPPSTCKPGEF